MTTIHLIRHGQASIGSSNYDVLSDTGRLQAQILGQYFQQINSGFDAILSGTLQRQIDTACISTSTPPERLAKNAAFNEYQHSQIFTRYAPLLAGSDSNGNSLSTYDHNVKLTYSTFSFLMNTWVEDNTPHDSLESWEQFKARVKTGLTEVIQNNNTGNIAIFTSGGVICTILHLLTEFPVPRIFELNWGIYNASITTLKVHNGKPTLSSYNNISHLALENNDSLITNI